MGDDVEAILLVFAVMIAFVAVAVAWTYTDKPPLASALSDKG